MPTSVERLRGVSDSLGRKAPARVATTANITLAGLQTIDGVALVDQDRVLVKDQTTGSQNGIYNASSGNWTRALDFDGGRDIVSGTAVFVVEGSTSAGREYYVSNVNPITIGTTALLFLSGSNSVSMTFNTRAEAIVTRIPASILSVMTLGAYVKTDLGGGKYIRADAAPSHQGYFQSLDGAYWVLSCAQDLRPEMFGAKGDGTEEAALLQNCCTAAIALAAIAGKMTIRYAKMYSVATQVNCHSSLVSHIGDSPSGCGYASHGAIGGAQVYLLSCQPGSASGITFAGTSATNLAIAVASKTFVTQAGLGFATGAYVRAASVSMPGEFMFGTVTSYSGTTLVMNSTRTSQLTFTANTNDTLTYQQATTYATGTKVQVTTTTTLPAPLGPATDYYIIALTPTTFYLAASLANALAGTRIDITTTGTGTHSIGLVLTDWQFSLCVQSSPAFGTSSLTLSSPNHGLVADDYYVLKWSIAAIGTNPSPWENFDLQGEINQVKTIASNVITSMVPISFAGPAAYPNSIQKLTLGEGLHIENLTFDGTAGSGSVSGLQVTFALNPIIRNVHSKNFNRAVVPYGVAITSCYGGEISCFDTRSGYQDSTNAIILGPISGARIGPIISRDSGGFGIAMNQCSSNVLVGEIAAYNAWGRGVKPYGACNNRGGVLIATECGVKAAVDYNGVCIESGSSNNRFDGIEAYANRGAGFWSNGLDSKNNSVGYVDARANTGNEITIQHQVIAGGYLRDTSDTGWSVDHVRRGSNTMSLSAIAAPKLNLVEGIYAECQRATSTQTIAGNAWVKVELNSELVDTDAAYDPTTNFRFTVPIYGDYEIAPGFRLDSIPAGTRVNGAIYKNGVNVSRVIREASDSYTFEWSFVSRGCIPGDYFEIYTNVEDASGANHVVETLSRTLFRRIQPL